MENYVFISIQDKTGDSKMKLQWDKNDKKAKEFAKQEFIRLQEAGYRIFAVKKIMGLLPVKGKEVKEYDPKLGAVFYEEEGQEDKEYSYAQITEKAGKYEEPRKFDPEKEEVTPENSYVATGPLRAG